MIEIILPSYLPTAIIVIVIVMIIGALIWLDLTRGTGGLGVLFILVFLVAMIVMWGVLSMFGWMPPTGALIPPGPQIFNISMGAP
jgi:hypothetical protein